jgi:ribosomal protein S18 acetylase RimI-like enzyme
LCKLIRTALAARNFESAPAGIERVLILLERSDKIALKQRSTPMNYKILLKDISLRTELQPGDLGGVIHQHGTFYAGEYGYGVQFEYYVARGLCEFYEGYDPKRNRIWICEHQGAMIGFLLLMDRGDAAQLRYFLIQPGYQGMGLGSKLMGLYMDFMRECGYQKSYLWTTNELDTAISLYKKFGFQLAEEKTSTSFGKPVTEQRYDLVLS